MIKNLSKLSKPTAALGFTASTAGASTGYSDKIDMQGFSGCMFTALFRSTGASTGTATFTVVGTNTSTADSTSYATIDGASVTIPKSTSATSKRWASIDIWLPKYRYMKAKVSRKTKIGLNNVLAQQYGAGYLPTVPGTSTIATATVALGNVLVVAGT